MKWTYIIVGTILSAFCYRIGGMSKESAKHYFPWFPQFLVKSWFRDLNCTLITLGFFLLFVPHVSWWWYLLFCGSAYGAMTTYHDERPYNWMRPRDNFFLHGFFIGLATLFITIPAHIWFGGLIRPFVLALFMGIWCAVFTNDFFEEFGRGGAIIATLILYMG